MTEPNQDPPASPEQPTNPHLFKVEIDYDMATGNFTVTGPVHMRGAMKLILMEAYDFICAMHPLIKEKPLVQKVGPAAVPPLKLVH